MPKQVITSDHSRGWFKGDTIHIESIVILVIAVLTIWIQNGQMNTAILLSAHTAITISGSMFLWFVTRYVLERMLQTRIEKNMVTKFLPLELMGASALLTTSIYLPFYLTLIYLNQSSFVLANLLQGYLLTLIFCLFIVVIYLGSQVWNSWWSDGEFLFGPKEHKFPDVQIDNFITITNAKGTTKIDLEKVLYFISELKIVFLVDTAGKKWITQYNLSELEEMLGQRFFRLNRGILVSRQVIVEIKKLPNHRLLVTLAEDQLQETISRYKSTKFKQWFHHETQPVTIE